MKLIITRTNDDAFPAILSAVQGAEGAEVAVENLVSVALGDFIISNEDGNLDTIHVPASDMEALAESAQQFWQTAATWSDGDYYVELDNTDFVDINEIVEYLPTDVEVYVTETETGDGESQFDGESEPEGEDGVPLVEEHTPSIGTLNSVRYLRTSTNTVIQEPREVDLAELEQIVLHGLRTQKLGTVIEFTIDLCEDECTAHTEDHHGQRKIVVHGPYLQHLNGKILTGIL